MIHFVVNDRILDFWINPRFANFLTPFNLILIILYKTNVRWFDSLKKKQNRNIITTVQSSIFSNPTSTRSPERRFDYLILFLFSILKESKSTQHHGHQRKHGNQAKGHE